MAPLAPSNLITVVKTENENVPFEELPGEMQRLLFQKIVQDTTIPDADTAGQMMQLLLCIRRDHVHTLEMKSAAASRDTHSQFRMAMLLARGRMVAIGPGPATSPSTGVEVLELQFHVPARMSRGGELCQIPPHSEPVRVTAFAAHAVPPYTQTLMEIPTPVGADAVRTALQYYWSVRRLGPGAAHSTRPPPPIISFQPHFTIEWDTPPAGTTSGILAVEAASAGHFRFARANAEAFRADLIGRRLLGLIDDEDEGLAEMAAAVIPNTVRQTRIDATSRFTRLLAAARAGLSAEKMNELRNKLEVAPGRAAQLLLLLSPEDRGKIETSFLLAESMAASALDAKPCEHIGAVAQLLQSNGVGKRRAALDNVRGFIRAGKVATLADVACRLCAKMVVCPHVISQFETGRLGPFTVQVEDGEMQCRICSEVLQSVLPAGMESRDDRFDSGGDNPELQTAIWAELTQTMKMVQFGPALHVPRLITAARNQIYPFISAIHTSATRSRTASEEEIQAQTTLHTAIFAYAYATHLILVTAAQPPNMRVTFRNAPSSGPAITAAQLLRFSINELFASRSSVIRLVPNVTADWIKNRIVDSYRAISSRSVQLVRSVSLSRDEVRRAIMTEPIWQYFRTFANSDDSVLDPDLSWRGVVVRLNLKRRMAAASGAERDAFALALHIAATLEGETPPPLAISGRKMAPSLVRNLGFRRRDYSGEKLNLGRIYDESGARHTFSILVGADGKEYPARQPSPAPITDRKCAECRILQSKSAAALRNETILQGIRDRIKYSNFWKFYLVRCPRGDIHIGEGRCTKCGYGAALPAQEMENYYKEFRAQYEGKVAGMNRGPSSRPTPAHAPVPGPDPPTPNWEMVIRAAETFHINPKFFSAIGAFESRRFEDVYDGSYTPPPIETRDSGRISAVISYTLGVLRRIAQLPQLSSIITEWAPRFADWRKSAAPPDTIYLAHVQFLAELLLAVWEINHDLAKTLFVRITTSEDSLTRPGAFNRAVYSGNHSYSTAVRNDEVGGEEGGADDGGGDESPITSAEDEDGFDAGDDGDEDQSLLRFSDE